MKAADARAGEFALRFLVEPLQLRDEAFERFRDFGRAAVCAPDAQLDRVDRQCRKEAPS